MRAQLGEEDQGPAWGSINNSPGPLEDDSLLAREQHPLDGRPQQQWVLRSLGGRLRSVG